MSLSYFLEGITVLPCYTDFVVARLNLNSRVIQRESEAIPQPASLATRIIDKMPLLILCGFPCSGKTTRALQLKSCFEENGRKVFLVSDDDMDKNESYANSRNEKDLRGRLKAAVEK